MTPVKEESTTEQVESAEARETNFPEIEITIDKDTVNIGKRGKLVKLSGVSKESTERKDYSEERREILKVLIENAGGDPITIEDLWAMSFPGREVEEGSFNQIRIWLEKLTYRRSPIVIHNGMRGAYSGYSIPNPNVSLVIVDTTKSKNKDVVQETVQQEFAAETELQSTVEQTQLTEEIADLPVLLSGQNSDTEVNEPEVTTVPEEVKENVKPVVKTEVRNTPPVVFPLNHAQSSILAEFLYVRSEMLSEFGIPKIDPEVATKLQEGMSVTKLAEEMAKYGNNLEKLRMNILATVNRYFENETQAIADVTNMSELDFRYPLFEYLFELEAEDRKLLLDELVTAKAGIQVTVGTNGAPRTGQNIVDVKGVLYSADGSVLGDEPEQVIYASEDDDYAKFEEDVLFADLDSISEEADTISDDESEYLETDLDSQVTMINKPENNRNQWLEEVIESAKEVLESFEADGLLIFEIASAKDVSLRSSSFLMGTKEMLRRGKNHGLINHAQSLGNEDISITTWIGLALQNKFPEIFSQKRKRREVMREIATLVELRQSSNK